MVSHHKEYIHKNQKNLNNFCKIFNLHKTSKQITAPTTANNNSLNNFVPTYYKNKLTPRWLILNYIP